MRIIRADTLFKVKVEEHLQHPITVVCKCWSNYCSIYTDIAARIGFSEYLKDPLTFALSTGLYIHAELNEHR